MRPKRIIAGMYVAGIVLEGAVVAGITAALAWCPPIAVASGVLGGIWVVASAVGLYQATRPRPEGLLDNLP